MILTVTVPDAKTFDDYYYGGGEYVSCVPVTLANGQVWFRYTVVYDNRQGAQLQANRFASGLYGAQVLDAATDKVEDEDPTAGFLFEAFWDQSKRS